MRLASANCGPESHCRSPSAPSFLIRAWSMEVVIHRQSLLSRVTGAWKTQITPPFTISFTLRVNEVLKSIEVALCATRNLGAGKTRAGLERPHLWPRLPGQSDPWGRSSPAQRKGSCFARAQESEHAVCNAGCNASRMTKGERQLGTFESTIKTAENYDTPGPPNR